MAAFDTRMGLNHSLLRRCVGSMIVLGSALALGCSGDADPAEESMVDPGGGKVTPPGGKADSPFDGPVWEEDVWEQIAARCTPPAEDEPVVYSNDFKWDYTREEMATRADEMYGSGKRLLDRAYYEEETGTFVLPILESWGGRVTLSRRLVENVTLHIQKSLQMGYAEHVFFPDMGHSHYFIPQALWESEYAGGAVSEIAQMRTRLIDDPELLVLYHTAEQLDMLDENKEPLDDPWIRFRLETRNVVGDNDWKGEILLPQNPESKANTVKDMDGHRYYGAGFSIHASEDGCFPFYQGGELKWYDLSFSDLPYQSTGGGF